MAMPVKFQGFGRVLSTTNPLGIFCAGQKRLEFGNTTITTEGAVSSSLLFGIGTSTTPLEVATAGKMMSFYLKNSATTTAEGFYLRHYQSGAGSSGEALRAFQTVYNVAAGNAYGIHASLSFGTSGTVTGLGCAGRFTLQIPNSAAQAGTMCAVMAEIWSDGATSDPAGATTLSFFRAVVSGDTTGDDDVITDAVLFDLTDIGASAAGAIWYDHDGTAGGDTIGEWLRIKTPNGIRYIPVCDAQH